MSPITREQQAELMPFRAHLQSSEAKGWERFDDAVFKLSAGGLALSVTFLGVVKTVDLASMPWVYGAWACWAMSLLVSLLSIVTAQLGLRSQIRYFDAATYYEVAHPEGRWGRLTPGLNIFGVIATSSGLICLFVFALTNLSGRPEMTQNERPADAPVRTTVGPLEKKGMVAPQAPPVSAPVPTSVSPQQLPGAGQVAPIAPPAPQTPAPSGPVPVKP